MWLQTEPYQSHFIHPNRGPTLAHGPKTQTPHHLATQRKLRLPQIPKSKYEALKISEIGGPFERKVVIYYS